MRKVYTLGVVLGTFGGLWILEAQDKQNDKQNDKQSPNFTGGTVTRLEEGTKAAIAHFRFDPGARTKWHSHEGGQIILVEEGVAHTQVKGGPVIELKAGESIYAGPGVMHWHGAAPDKGGIQYNVTRGGITWGDPVTDQEFRTPPRR
jgi:quercetin dioxygenase-like cupin family protein